MSTPKVAQYQYAPRSTNPPTLARTPQLPSLLRGVFATANTSTALGGNAHAQAALSRSRRNCVCTRPPRMGEGGQDHRLLGSIITERGITMRGRGNGSVRIRS